MHKHRRLVDYLEQKAIEREIQTSVEYTRSRGRELVANGIVGGEARLWGRCVLARIIIGRRTARLCHHATDKHRRIITAQVAQET